MAQSVQMQLYGSVSTEPTEGSVGMKLGYGFYGVLSQVMGLAGTAPSCGSVGMKSCLVSKKPGCGSVGTFPKLWLGQ